MPFPMTCNVSGVTCKHMCVSTRSSLLTYRPKVMPDGRVFIVRFTRHPEIGWHVCTSVTWTWVVDMCVLLAFELTVAVCCDQLLLLLRRSIVYLLTSCVKHRLYSRDCHNTVTGSDVSIDVTRVLFHTLAHFLARSSVWVTRRHLYTTGWEFLAPEVTFIRHRRRRGRFGTCHLLTVHRLRVARFVQSALADAYFKMRSAP